MIRKEGRLVVFSSCRAGVVAVNDTSSFAVCSRDVGSPVISSLDQDFAQRGAASHAMTTFGVVLSFSIPSLVFSSAERGLSALKRESRAWGYANQGHRDWEGIAHALWVEVGDQPWSGSKSLPGREPQWRERTGNGGLRVELLGRAEAWNLEDRLRKNPG
ncbi:MAG: hypothetical protein MK171_10960 [Pirellulales bacterium]|nr:hypothetical protein [Pirellulales bacterium]